MPGPAVTAATPATPVRRATASAANTAVTSWRTSTMRMPRALDATKMGLMWPPTSVNTCFTPCASNTSATRSPPWRLVSCTDEKAVVNMSWTVLMSPVLERVNPPPATLVAPAPPPAPLVEVGEVVLLLPDTCLFNMNKRRAAPSVLVVADAMMKQCGLLLGVLVVDRLCRMCVDAILFKPRTQLVTSSLTLAAWSSLFYQELLKLR